MLSFGHLPLRTGGSIQRLILHISGGFSYVWFYLQPSHRCAGRFHRTSALRNIVLGILGSFVGGILFGLVGLSATGLVGEIIVSVIGACVCIWAGRKLFK